MTDPPASVTAALQQLDQIIERDLDEPFVQAMRQANYHTGNPGPHWRELADRLRRGADLADWLAANDR